MLYLTFSWFIMIKMAKNLKLKESFLNWSLSDIGEKSLNIQILCEDSPH